MAGPTAQSVQSLIIPPGESLREYSPNVLAQRVQNLYLTSEDTLASVVGPAPYGNTTYPSDQFMNGYPHSVFHASLLNGSSGLIFARVGNRIYRFEGWQSPLSFPAATGGQWVEQIGSLSNTPNQRFPDQWVVLNDMVIWCNGIDQARVFTFDGMVTRLGFSRVPGSPTVFGPDSPQYQEAGMHYPNTFGYSWPGLIGSAGDSLDGQAGALMAGRWYYYVQYEDIHGNLSAFSRASNPAQVATVSADPFLGGGEYDTGAEINDLMRRFHVSIGDEGPEHAIARRLYRSPDSVNVGTAPQFLVRIPGVAPAEYGDNTPDSGLGQTWDELEPVPTFKLMCTHQGRLVVANTLDDPGVVRRSEPGFPGTFGKYDYIYPDSGGSEVTGITSHNGVLLAFTETSVYSLAQFDSPTPLAQGIGCVAPRSIKALPDGTLVWLGRDGFYGMRAMGQIQRISAPIERLMRQYLNRAMMRMAVAVIDPVTREYRCSLAKAGSQYNNLTLCFDGEYWRRQELNMHIADTCQTDDWRQCVLGLVQDYTAYVDPTSADYTMRKISAESHVDPDQVGAFDTEDQHQTQLVVFDRESQYYRWAPPKRTVKYRSAWLRGDEMALTPINVRSIYLGMIDAWDGNATVRIYKNGSRKVVSEIKDLRLVGVDNDSDVVKDIAGSAINGKSKMHDPRLFWRQVPVGLENVNTWAFEIEVETPTRMHLASFAFETSVATSGSPRGRIPRRADK